MSKQSKRALACILVMMFAVTMFPCISFAESSTIKTGEDISKLSYRLYPGGSASKFVYGTLSSENGVYGKKTDDKVYKINSTAVVQSDGIYVEDPTKSLVKSADGGDIQMHNIATIGANKDFAIEFSFCFTDVVCSIGSYIRTSAYASASATARSNNNNSSFKITPTSASIGYQGSAVAADIGVGRWHNATLVFDIEQDSTLKPGTGKKYTHKLYIDGVPIDSDTVEYPIMNSFSLFRLHNATKNTQVYYDNLDIYAIDDASTFVPAEATKTVLSTTTDNYEIIEDTIAAPVNATVSDVKAAVSTSLKQGDDIRFYNSDYSAELSNEELAKGSKVVVASKRPGTNIENAFSYYTVDKWVYKFSGLNKGDTLISIGGNSSEFSEVVSEAGGLGGKTADDAYLKFTDASGRKYLQAGSNARKAYEFSLMLTDECDNSGVELETGIYVDGPDEFEAGNSRFTFSKSGVYHGTVKYADMPLNQWVNFAIVSPGGPVAGTEIKSDGQLIGYSEYDDTYEFYMNGEFLFEAHGTDVNHATGYGLRHNRFSGTSKEGTPSCYLDNIRCVSDKDGYNPKYDKKADVSIENLDTIANVINIAGSAKTVEQFKASVGEDDSYAIRVYSPNDILLLDNEEITEGSKVVIAANNTSEVERAYSYYTVRVIDNEYAFDTPLLSVKNGMAESNVKLYNYSGNEQVFYVYLATYYGGELVSVSETELKAESDAVAWVTPSMQCPQNHTAKLFVWASDRKTPELVSAK